MAVQCPDNADLSISLTVNGRILIRISCPVGEGATITQTIMVDQQEFFRQAWPVIAHLAGGRAENRYRDEILKTLPPPVRDESHYNHHRNY